MNVLIFVSLLRRWVTWQVHGGWLSAVSLQSHFWHYQTFLELPIVSSSTWECRVICTATFRPRFSSLGRVIRSLLRVIIVWLAPYSSCKLLQQLRSARCYFARKDSHRRCSCSAMLRLSTGRELSTFWGRNAFIFSTTESWSLILVNNQSDTQFFLKPAHETVIYT